ncbi:hypothetical protein L6R29_08945 [Myxococcota bacterium]|nr:hypothetical protein [Myxococcota bacterium]
MQKRMIVGWMIALIAWCSSEAWAKPTAQTLGNNKAYSHQTERAERAARSNGSKEAQGHEIVRRLRLAQSQGDSKQNKDEEIPGGQWPVGAWVLEGVGAAVVIGGLVCFSLSAGRMTDRDRKIKEANEDIKNNGFSDVSASAVKQAEDEAITLGTVGWIVTGVGVGLVLVGAIWMFVHRPPQPKYVRRDLPTLPNAPTWGHLRTSSPRDAAPPALLFRSSM